MGHSERDQGWLLSNWLRAVRTGRLPHFEAQVEDGQGDWRQKDGRSPFLEVQRDGSVQLRAAAAIGVRHLQELRGLVACCIHGWQWCGHVGQGDLLRAQGGSGCWRQEEVSRVFVGSARLCTAWAIVFRNDVSAHFSWLRVTISRASLYTNPKRAVDSFARRNRPL